jgi:ribonuclease HII
MSPSFEWENKFTGTVVGVDEVGRGPWAGPVVAAAVVLDRACVPSGLADSKTLSAARRMQLASDLRAAHMFALGIASVEEIDRLNILRATELAMQRAVASLSLRPDHVLVDGNRAPVFAAPATAIVRGDAHVASIAAASIVAKVARDALMVDFAGLYPAYAWEYNKGYGTAAHAAGLAHAGVSPLHRRSFAPIAKLLAA